MTEVDVAAAHLLMQIVVSSLSQSLFLLAHNEYVKCGDPWSHLLLVCTSVSLSVCHMGCAKMSKSVSVLFGVETPGDIVLDGGRYPPTVQERGFHVAFAKLLWLHLINSWVLSY